MIELTRVTKTGTTKIAIYHSDIRIIREAAYSSDPAPPGAKAHVTVVVGGSSSPVRDWFFVAESYDEVKQRMWEDELAYALASAKLCCEYSREMKAHTIGQEISQKRYETLILALQVAGQEVGK